MVSLGLAFCLRRLRLLLVGSALGVWELASVFRLRGRGFKALTLVLAFRAMSTLMTLLTRAMAEKRQERKHRLTMIQGRRLASSELHQARNRERVGAAGGYRTNSPRPVPGGWVPGWGFGSAGLASAQTILTQLSFNPLNEILVK